MRSRKRTAWVLITFVVAMLVAGCSGPAESGRPESTLRAEDFEGTEWMLVSLHGEGLVEGSAITLGFYPDNYLEGHAGCNYFGVDYEASGNEFSAAEIHKTPSHCDAPPGIMEQEAAFFATLTDAAAYWGTEDRLEFDDAEGQMVLAFDRKRPPLVDPNLVDTEWLLVSLQGEDLLEGSQITLDLGSLGFGGFSGCNRYGGEYEAADGGVLLTGEIAMTAMECPTPGLTDQEQTYVEALRSAVAYRIVDDRLEIDNAGGETILAYARKEEVSMDPVDLLGTQWRLLSLNGSDLVEGTTLTLAFHNEYRVSGHAGCRDYVATYQASGNDMGFLFFSMIEADCPMPEALLEQEGQFTTILGWTSDYRLGDGQLEIVTERGEVLVFEALPEEANASLEGTLWSLTSFVEEGELEEMPVPHLIPMDRIAKTQVTATFDDGKVTGSAGCNRYQATYTAEGSSIVVEAPGATKMACLEPEGVMEQEQRYLDYLADATDFHIYSNQLWLETGDGRALVFSTQVSSYGLSDLLEDLSAAGLTAEETGQPADHGFAVEGRQVLVGGDTVSVYEFPDATAASSAAAGVTADSYSVTVRRTEGDVTVETHSDWVETPHLFRKGRLIVISGDHPELLDVLESVLGPQFAGG